MKTHKGTICTISLLLLLAFNAKSEHIFLNGTSGSDSKDGKSIANAVKTFAKAKSLISAGDTIFICGTITISANEEWELSDKGAGGTGPGIVMRWVKGSVSGINDDTFSSTLINVNITNGDSLTINNITIDGGDTLVSNDSNPPCILRIQSGKALLSQNCILQNNKTKQHGGIVRLESGLLRMEENALITHGACINKTEVKSHCHGGCVWVQSGSFLMEDNAIISNGICNGVYSYGGCVEIDNGTLLMSGNTIISDGMCIGDHGNGGGICIKKGMVQIKDSGRIMNSSASYGGGVSLYKDTLKMEGTSCIMNNEATFGGGIYSYGGNIRLKNGSSITNNTALYGGGVSIQTLASLQMDGMSSITYNKGYNNGGGVRLSGSTLQMNDKSNIANNSTKVGGGVYVYEASVVMNGGTIFNNLAEDKGGGAFIYTSTFTMNKGVISNNTAKNGGGVFLGKNPYNRYTSIFDMKNGTITNNTANEGGGVFVDSLPLCKMNISNTVSIINNNGTLSKKEMNNVYLNKNNKIYVTGALSENSSIGITVVDSVHIGEYYFAKGSNYTVTKKDAAVFSDDFSHPIDIELDSMAVAPGKIRFAPTYTVNYDGNNNTGGNAPIDSTLYNLGDPAIILGSNILTKTKAVLYGWSAKQITASITETNDTIGKEFQKEGSTITVIKDTTLYAVWAIDLNENGTPDFDDAKTKITADYKWPETSPNKPKWNVKYDMDNSNTWIAAAK